MKKLKLLILLILFSGNIFSQGTNNNFKFDDTDFNIIFKTLGISTFKFPVKQSTNQLFNIIIEEYENGTQINRTSLIDEIKEKFGKFGMDGTTYFKVDRDSVYFHRFYFSKQDDSVNLLIKSHGIESKHKFNLQGKSTFSYNAYTETSLGIEEKGYLEINENKTLLYIYANSTENADRPLLCPSGLKKSDLVKSYYYLVIIEMEVYK
jgi:hypothetical protein